jgi:hypothetical protein
VVHKDGSALTQRLPPLRPWHRCSSLHHAHVIVYVFPLDPDGTGWRQAPASQGLFQQSSAMATFLPALLARVRCCYGTAWGPLICNGYLFPGPLGTGAPLTWNSMGSGAARPSKPQNLRTPHQRRLATQAPHVCNCSQVPPM